MVLGQTELGFGVIVLAYLSQAPPIYGIYVLPRQQPMNESTLVMEPSA
jgi:hypothetical protein